MACCKCCCGNRICNEGDEGKCCCGGTQGLCCQQGEYCCNGECQPEPCCPEPCFEDSDCSGRYCCNPICVDGCCVEPEVPLRQSIMYASNASFGVGHPGLCDGGGGQPTGRCDCGLPQSSGRYCFLIADGLPPEDGGGLPFVDPATRIGAPCDCGQAPVIVSWPLDKYPITPADYVVECRPLNPDGSPPSTIDPNFYPAICNPP